MTTFADSTMSPMMSMWPAPAFFWRACDRPMPIDESAIAGQKIGTLARYAAVRMPSAPVVFQRWPPSRCRNSREVYGRASSVARELGNPVVVADELFLAGVGVVDAVDPILSQRRVVGMRRADVVALPARFVQVVIEVRAGRDEAVDVAVQDEMRDDEPQAAGRQRARHAQEDRHIVLQHLLPDAVRGGEVAALKRDPLHAREHLIRRQSRLDGERLDRRLEKTGFLLHRRHYSHWSFVVGRSSLVVRRWSSTMTNDQ